MRRGTVAAGADRRSGSVNRAAAPVSSTREYTLRVRHHGGSTDRTTQSSPTAPRTTWAGEVATPTPAAAIRTAVDVCSVRTAVRGLKPARAQTQSRKACPSITASIAHRAHRCSDSARPGPGRVR